MRRCETTAEHDGRARSTATGRKRAATPPTQPCPSRPIRVVVASAGGVHDVIGLPAASAIRERRQPAESGRDRLSPLGLEACRLGLQTIVNYALQQSLIARKIDVEKLFDATTRGLSS
jgi:hypothetical protein